MKSNRSLIDMAEQLLSLAEKMGYVVQRWKMPRDTFFFLGEHEQVDARKSGDQWYLFGLPIDGAPDEHAAPGSLTAICDLGTLVAGQPIEENYASDTAGGFVADRASNVALSGGAAVAPGVATVGERQPYTSPSIIRSRGAAAVLAAAGIPMTREVVRSAVALEGWRSKLTVIAGLSESDANAAMRRLVQISENSWLQLPAIWSDFFGRFCAGRGRGGDGWLAQALADTETACTTAEPRSYSHWGVIL